jgi:hypothetical protein
METNDNGFKSLKRVMYLVLFLVAYGFGLIVDCLASCLHGTNALFWTWENRDVWMEHVGTTVFGWNAAEHGLGTLLWTVIAFLVLCWIVGMHKYNSLEEYQK